MDKRVCDQDKSCWRTCQWKKCEILLAGGCVPQFCERGTPHIPAATHPSMLHNKNREGKAVAIEHSHDL